MKLTLVLIIGLVIVLGIIVACMFISYYNKFVKGKNGVEESFSTMDVYMKKRYDLIPNLVATVKGYAKHEKETLEAVIAARNVAASATTTEEKIASNNTLNNTLKGLFAVAEQYPTLQANTNFQELMSQLKAVENDIANARKYYNARVKSFNTSIETFPGNFFAKIYKKFTKYPFYVVEDEQERKNIKVEF